MDAPTKPPDDSLASSSVPPRRARQGSALAWLLALAILVGGGAWWWTSRDPAPPTTGAKSQGSATPGAGARRFGGSGAPQPVSVDTVRRQDVAVTVDAIGSVDASNTAVVRAQVSGLLQSLNFREGQQVRAGQMLAQLDARGFEATLGQVLGTLARDQAQLAGARLDLERYRGLLAKDAIPKQQLDSQVVLVGQLDGTVKADQGAVDAARLQLSYARVTAPISGRVGLKQVDLGNMVQPSDANGIVSITQTRPMALVFSVPAQHIPTINAHLKANKPLPVQALDRSGKTPLAVGRVASIDNAIDPTTDTIKVKALFDNKDDTLFPNQAVNVRLQLDTLVDALVVPQAAVLQGSKGFYVYAVADDGTVHVRVLTPGPVSGNWMAVTGPLEPGERVVIDGVDRLRDGAKVEVIASDPLQRAGAAVPKAGTRRAKGPAGAASAATPGQSRNSAAPVDAGGSGAAPKAAAGAGKAAASTSVSDSEHGSGSGSGDRPRWMDRVPPEVAKKLEAMTPEERQAWFQQRRAEAGGATSR